MASAEGYELRELGRRDVSYRCWPCLYVFVSSNVGMILIIPRSQFMYPSWVGRPAVLMQPSPFLGKEILHFRNASQIGTQNEAITNDRKYTSTCGGVSRIVKLFVWKFCRNDAKW